MCVCPQNAGWWSYEFCYLRHIRQFHTHRDETTGKLITKGFILGTWNHTSFKDITTHTHIHTHTQDIEGAAHSSSVQERYASQMYENGTKCDLVANKRRSVEVRFFCNDQVEENVNANTNNNKNNKNNNANAFLGMHRIVTLKETSTCEYTLTVTTGLICEHKAFAPTHPLVKEIVCEALPVRRAVYVDK